MGNVRINFGLLVMEMEGSEFVVFELSTIR